MTSEDVIVRQSVYFGAVYDSNILESHSNAIRDGIFFINPNVDITKDMGKDVAELNASVTGARYAFSDHDNYTDVYVNLRDTYFITPVSDFTVNASVSDGYQRRISRNFDIPSNAAGPIPEMVYFGSAAYRQHGYNWDAGISFTASREDFSDVLSTSGTLLDQTFRNEKDVFVDGFFDMQLGSMFKSHLTAQGSDIEYKLEERDYTQWRVAETLTAELTSKTSIGFLIAFKEQDLYKNPLVHLGLLMEYEAQLEWHPTERLFFRATGGYRDLGVDYVAGIYAGGFSPRYTLNSTYLIWRNLQLTSGLEFETRYLAGNFDVENILHHKTALTYEINSYAGISLLYDLQQWSSHLPINTFSENVIQSSFVIRF